MLGFALDYSSSEQCPTSYSCTDGTKIQVSIKDTECHQLPNIGFSETTLLHWVSKITSYSWKSQCR